MNEPGNRLQGNDINEKLESLNLNSNNNSNQEENSVTNIHNRAYEYLESLEKKYHNDLDTIYSSTESMMTQVRKAPNFSTGLKKAIEEYKTIITKIDDQNKNKFILIQFLEEFYQGFSTDDTYYTPAVHENNFKEALYLAQNVGNNHELLKNIYNFDTSLIGDPGIQPDNTDE